MRAATITNMPGKSNEPLIVVDADAIISFVYINDTIHSRAKAIMHYLASTKAYILYPTTAICEAVTVLKRKLNVPEDAAAVAKKFQSGALPIQAVDQETLDRAGDYFDPHGSKKDTLFDAVIAALANELHADAIFSFDEWYKKQGFTLAEDLLAEEKQAA